MEIQRVYRPLAAESYADLNFLEQFPEELTSTEPEIQSMSTIGITFVGKQLLLRGFAETDEGFTEFIDSLKQELPGESNSPLVVSVEDTDYYGNRRSHSSIRRPVMVLKDTSGLLAEEDEIIRSNLPEEVLARLRHFRPHLSPIIVVKSNINSNTGPLLLDWLAENAPHDVVVNGLNIFDLDSTDDNTYDLDN